MKTTGLGFVLFFVLLGSDQEETAKGGTLDPTAFCFRDFGTFTMYLALRVLNLDQIGWSF